MIGLNASTPVISPTPSALSESSRDAHASQVELILSRIEALPTLSGAATTLLASKSSSTVDIAQVIRLIEADPALSVRLLKLCRTASTGLGERITTVKRAVLMLGLDTVRSAALSVSVYNLLSANTDSATKHLETSVALAAADAGGPLLFDRAGFWQYSVGVACCAEAIAQMHPRLKVLGAEAFLAGLLHGIGKLVLEFALPQAYGGIVRLARARASDSAPIEQALLGVDYLTAGRAIAQRWGLPPAVCKVIWQHNLPAASLNDDEDKNLILTVIAGRALARSLHLGWTGDFSPPVDPAITWSQCNFDRSERELHHLARVSAASLEHANERLFALGLTSVTNPSTSAQPTKPPQPEAAAPPHLITLGCIQRANQAIHCAHDRAAHHAAIAIGSQRLIASLTAFAHAANRSPTSSNSNSPPNLPPLHAAAIDILLNAKHAMSGGSHALILTLPSSPAPLNAAPAQQWQCFTLNSRAALSLTTLPAPQFVPNGARAAAYATNPLLQPAQLNIHFAGLAPWLGNILGSAAAPNQLRVLMLSPTGTAINLPAPHNPRALLVSTKELRAQEALGPLTPIEPLLSAWWHRLFPAATGVLPSPEVFSP